MRLADKVAVVHGAGGAVGAAIARRFARDGATVFLAGRSAPRLEPLKSELGAAVAVVDAMDEAEVEAHTRHVVQTAGRIDIVINAMNPEPTQGVALIDLDAAAFSSPIHRWTLSQFLTSRSVARTMIDRKDGVILTLSASPARLAIPGTGGFGVACAAIEGLTRTLAAELGGHGIRVIGLRPQKMSDALGEAADLPMPMDQFKSFLEAMTLTGRLPTLNDVASAAVFAASDEGRGMSGSMINLTAGMDVG